MQSEREGNVQQINKKIDNIWEQAKDLADRVSSVMEFLQGPQPATPCADETVKQSEKGWFDRMNDRLENIIAVLDGCVIQSRRLQEEGFISYATQVRYDDADQERLEEIQRGMQEGQEPSPQYKEDNNG